MKFYACLILCLISITAVFAQQPAKTAALQKAFDEFNYEKVITEADKLLVNKDSLTNNQLVEIYKFKGISHFILQHDDAAKNNFMDLLKIDSTYSLDSSQTSPKIISFFNKVKDEYLSELQRLRSEFARQKSDTVFVTKLIPNVEAEEILKQSTIRSIFIPGWGHLYKGQTLKGLLLMGLTAVTAGASIYFAVQTNKRKEEYYSGSDKLLLPSLYEKYNRAYKSRNISLIALAAVWLYSQLDILIFQNFNQDPESFTRNMPGVIVPAPDTFFISYQITF